jgi:hypothetical protein
MDKNKLAAIEILSKVKDSLGNIIASGEYTNDDKRNLLKTKAALKWLREGKETPDEQSNCIKPAVCECDKPNTDADRKHGLKLCRNCKMIDSQTVL